MTTLLTRRPKTTPITPTSLFMNPFRLLNEMNRWDPFLDTNLQPWTYSADFLPAFELKETSKELVVKADLPGIKDKDLEITVTGNHLNISGKREEEKVQDGEICHLVERTYGSFKRIINLPEGIDANKIQAQLKEGVLTLTLPKSLEIMPQKVNVKTV